MKNKKKKLSTMNCQVLKRNYYTKNMLDSITIVI